MSSSAITGPVLSDVRRAPAGTAAAPSFAFNDSTGTGVYLVSAGVLGLSTAGVQRVVVDASGNVGIGTASPKSNLHVSGNLTLGGGAGFLHALYYSSGWKYAAATNSLGFAIYSDNTGLTFNTAPASGVVDAAATLSERMRLDASGNLLVGTATSVNGSGASVSTANRASSCILSIQAAAGAGYDAKLYIECPGFIGAGFTARRSDQRLHAWAGTEFTGPYLTPNGANWTANSDERMKKDIEEIPYGLSSILALAPKKFKYINGEKECLGFIAQEVLPIVPEVVDVPKDSENMMGVEYPSFVPILVKAMQEQQEIIEKLEARLAALESK